MSSREITPENQKDVEIHVVGDDTPTQSISTNAILQLLGNQLQLQTSSPLSSTQESTESEPVTANILYNTVQDSDEENSKAAEHSMNAKIKKKLGPRKDGTDSVEHGSSSGAQTAVFDRWSDRHCPTEAPAGGSDRPVRSVPGTGCTGPARTGRTNLSDQLALASVGQCPSDHRSNTAVRAPLEQPCSTG
ncbi:hypothetical protein PCANC_23803 [Puccinia coronata f. sp. avenae]|uniref:Uncharacterized protein n=1 Tax=Puccinia coronata f. sp. avenae TaxID=200324 RepID=A0A2N5S9L8_9BASI|nr:hypothetical protein PCANC_23803 [Puccinia coronata f. sp. avenae]